MDNYRVINQLNRLEEKVFELKLQILNDIEVFSHNRTELYDQIDICNSILGDIAKLRGMIER